MFEKLLNALQERQLWVSLFGLLAVLGVGYSADVEPDKLIDAILIILGVLVGGTSIKDGLSRMGGTVTLTPTIELVDEVEEKP